MKKQLVTLAVMAAFAAAPASAQLGGFKNPLAGGGSGQSVDADGVKKSVAAALTGLVEANSRYASALGKEADAAKLKEIASGLKSGTLGVDSKLITTVSELSASSVAEMKARQESKDKMSADGKKLLAEGLAYHVSGTVEGFNGSKKLKAALQSKSPAAMASLASLKDFPVMFGQWTSATGNMLSYMSYNGIDTAKADQAINAAMKDG